MPLKGFYRVLSATVFLIQAVAIVGIINFIDTESILDHPVSASNCSLCSPGYGEVTPCTGDTDTQCAQCNTGFFSRNSSHSPCQQCSSCHDDEFEVERCTPTSDTVCQKCSSCDPGFGVIEPCGQSTDTVCGLCPLSTDVRYPLDKCLPCTGCLVKDDQDPLAEFQDSDKEIERLIIRQLAIANKKDLQVPGESVSAESIVKLAENRQHLPGGRPILVGRTSDQPPHTGFQCCLVIPQGSAELDSTRSYARTTPASPGDRITDSRSGNVATKTQKTSHIPTSHTTPTVYRDKKKRTKKKKMHGAPRPSRPKFVHWPTDEPPTKKRSWPKRPPSNDHPADPVDHMASVGHDEPRKDKSKSSQGMELQKECPVDQKNDESKQKNKVVRLPSSEPTGYSSGTPDDLTIFPPQYAVTSGSVDMALPSVISSTVKVGANPAGKGSGKSGHFLSTILAVVTAVTLLLVFTGVGVALWCKAPMRKAKYDTEDGCVPAVVRRFSAPSDCCDQGSVASQPVEYAPVRCTNLDSRHALQSDSLNENGSQGKLAPSKNRQDTPTEIVVTADVHGVAQETFESFSECCFDHCLKVERTFNCKGGTLWSRNSDMRINVDPGTIPIGSTQTLFSRIIYDERPLLGKLPEGPDRTLISPVFECGPSGILLQKPVEIVVPHCLSDPSNHDTIQVFRCDHQGSFPNAECDWEDVPAASKKTSHSKAWFTVDEDAVHIRTSSFSCWALFGAGTKRRRAVVLASEVDPGYNKISLRFYVYSDSKDSRMKTEDRDKRCFKESEPRTMDKPFKLYKDDNDLTVLLTELEGGWTVDKTPEEQKLRYESAYHDAFRTKDYCEFVVKPTRPNVEPFSALLKFRQENHNEHMIYVHSRALPAGGSQDSPSNNRDSPGNEPGPIGNSSGESRDHASESTLDTPANQSGVQEVNAQCSVAFLNELEESGVGTMPVTLKHLNEIYVDIGVDWRRLLRTLDPEMDKYIEIINEDNSYALERCYQGLKQWMEKAVSKATVGKLARALCAIKKPEIAVKLLEGQRAEAETCQTDGPVVAVSGPHPAKITTV